jgi:transcriptional regulator with XRE-family HTH domain
MKNLKKLRRAAGLTQQRLGQLTKLSRVRICHAELGLATLSVEEVSGIRKVLLEVSRKKSERLLKELQPGA